MKDYLNLWGITPYLRAERFQSILKDNPKAISLLEPLINTYPNWSDLSYGILILTHQKDVIKIMSNFCIQLWDKHSSKIRNFIMFNNLVDFTHPDYGFNNKQKLKVANLIIIFEVGTYKLSFTEQKEFTEILFNLNSRPINYILCSRVGKDTLAENIGVGLTDMLNTYCKVIVIK